MTEQQIVHALRAFKRLSPNVSVLSNGSYTVDKEQQMENPSQQMAGDQPELIILSTWMGAAPKHIAKYTMAYASLFPFATIAVVQTGVFDLMFRSNSSLLPRLMPAVTEVMSTTIRAAMEGRKPRIMVATFSNGGAFAFMAVAKIFQRLAGAKFPLAALILDSGPGLGNYARSVQAIMASLPKSSIVRLPTLFVVRLVLTLMKWINMLRGAESVITRTYKEMNHSTALRQGVPRLYLYSEGDKMVDWRDVEAHAMQAKKSGRAYVQNIKFGNTAHVAHLREQPDQYLAAVSACWKANGDFAG